MIVCTPRSQAFTTTRLILPWSLVATEVPSFTIFDFGDLFVGIAFTVAIICTSFTLGAIFVAWNVSLTPSLKKLHLILAGYVLPPVGNALFLPLINVLLSTFVCAPQLSSTGEFVMVESGSVMCYTGVHNTLMVISGISLVLYYPVALQNLPVRVNYIDYCRVFCVCVCLCACVCACLSMQSSPIRFGNTHKSTWISSTGGDMSPYQLNSSFSCSSSRGHSRPSTTDPIPSSLWMSIFNLSTSNSFPSSIWVSRAHAEMMIQLTSQTQGSSRPFSLHSCFSTSSVNRPISGLSTSLAISLFRAHTYSAHHPLT